MSAMRAQQLNLRYASYRALAADYEGYFSHGGAILRLSPAEAPAPGTKLLLQVVTPDGGGVHFSGEAGPCGPDGLLMHFEPGPAAHALAAFLSTEDVQAAIAAEREELPPSLDFEPTELPPSTTAPDIPRGGPAERTPEPPPRSEDLTQKPAPPADASQLAAPGPGERYPIYHLRFERVRGWLALAEELEAAGQLSLPEPPAELETAKLAQLKVSLPGNQRFEFWAALQPGAAGQVQLSPERADPSFRKLVAYPSTMPGRRRLASEQEDGGPPSVMCTVGEVAAEDSERVPIRRRLARMGMDDKINLALSSNKREERMALAMDGNKAIHHYLLKNLKLTMEEVAYMAHLPSLNPDVLEKIAKTSSYVQNQTVVKALVYNPRTPIGTAVRLVDRLPRSEWMTLSRRATMRAPLVAAAKKKLERR